MLSRAAYQANAAITDHTHHCSNRFFKSNSISIPHRKSFISSTSAARTGPVLAVATNETKSKRFTYEPSLADRLRLGSMTDDGMSYKEKFIVRCYEVGINKTATVETIANLLQVC